MTDHEHKPVLIPDSYPLDVRNITKRYRNGVLGNKDISFTAYPGEIIGLVGPNAAGKTTLVRQITTELLPTSGSVYVLGYDVVEEPILVKSVLGIVPQEVDLFDYLTVFQHLKIFGKLRGLFPKVAKKRAIELISDLGLSDYENTEVKKLSGGLRRRLLIAIAALANPPVLILDEPTTGLDPQSRQEVWGYLKSYREMGATVLLTTHYMEEAEALCDRIGVIQHGTLMALDSISNLRTSYGYEYKITYVCNCENSKIGECILYGPNDRDLIRQASDKGIKEFEISRTNLEDVYIALISGARNNHG